MDTQAFLWFVMNNRKSERACFLIEDAKNDDDLSIAGVWEITDRTSAERAR